MPRKDKSNNAFFFMPGSSFAFVAHIIFDKSEELTSSGNEELAAKKGFHALLDYLCRSSGPNDPPTAGTILCRGGYASPTHEEGPKGPLSLIALHLPLLLPGGWERALLMSLAMISWLVIPRRLSSGLRRTRWARTAPPWS